MLHTQLWEQLATVDSLLRLALLQSLHIQISGDGCWFALDGLLDRYKALGANFPTRLHHVAQPNIQPILREALLAEKVPLFRDLGGTCLVSAHLGWRPSLLGWRPLLF